MKDNSDRLLPLWYEQENTKLKASIHQRHSSAQQPDAFQSVCNYRLFPIKEQNADMLLFNAVWDIVMNPDFYDFYDNVEIVLSNPSIHNLNYDITWYRPYLLFPADEPNVDYTEKELMRPYLIAAFSEIGEIYAGEGGLVDEGDDVPYFRNYYVPEWSFANGAQEVIYREYSRGKESVMPRFYNNSVDMSNSISVVLEYLGTVYMDTDSWRERLRTAKRMIDTHANELHILHNAGLYDIDSLWTMLYRNNQDINKLRTIMRRYNHELHRYAMMSINLINWKNGGINMDGIMSDLKKPNN